MVQRPLVDENNGVFGDGITVDGRVRGCAVGDRNGDKRGESHDFVDEGREVRKMRLVCNGWKATAIHHSVDIFLKTFLDFWIPVM